MPLSLRSESFECWPCLKEGGTVRGIQKYYLPEIEKERDSNVRPSDDPLLTVSDLALKMKRPKSTIYYWSSRLEGFPKITAGRGILFRLRDVLEYFEAQAQKKKPSCDPVVEELKKRTLDRSLKIKCVGHARFLKKEK